VLTRPDGEAVALSGTGSQAKVELIAEIQAVVVRQV
jgi:hypothetical protein